MSTLLATSYRNEEGSMTKVRPNVQLPYIHKEDWISVVPSGFYSGEMIAFIIQLMKSCYFRVTRSNEPKVAKIMPVMEWDY